MDDLNSGTQLSRFGFVRIAGKSSHSKAPFSQMPQSGAALVSGSAGHQYRFVVLPGHSLLQSMPCFKALSSRFVSLVTNEPTNLSRAWGLHTSRRPVRLSRLRDSNINAPPRIRHAISCEPAPIGVIKLAFRKQRGDDFSGPIHRQQKLFTARRTEYCWTRIVMEEGRQILLEHGDLQRTCPICVIRRRGT